MDINVKVLNAEIIAQRLDRMPDTVMLHTAAIVVAHGQLLESAIKQNASGRPGPNAPTGDYRRSWNTRVRRGAGFVTSTTGTNRPQAARLEYGFHGTDALGRVYNQPAYPHAGPAMDQIEPLLVSAVEAALGRETL